MENTKREIIFKSTSHVDDFFALSPIKQRLKYFNEGTNMDIQVVHYEDDEKLCYIQEQINVKFSGKTFFKNRKVVEGFTYDKQTKKVTIWLGSTNYIAINGLFKKWLEYNKLEFVCTFNDKYTNITYFTGTMIAKIISGKITNHDAILRELLLKTFRFKVSDLDVSAFKELLLCMNNSHQNFFRRNIHTLKKFLNCCNNKKEAIRLFKNYDNEYLTILEDTIVQCQILQTKINPSWSYKRLSEEHNLYTTELMKLELETIEDEEFYTDISQSKFPIDFELISTKKRLFEEGYKMKHCIFTNYYGKIKDHKLIAFHLHEFNATLTIYRASKGTWHIDQMYSVRNNRLPNYTKEAVDQVLKDPDFINACDNLFSETEILTNQTQEAWF